MIVKEEDLIQTNLKDFEFERKFSALCDKYLHQIYSNYLIFSFENTQTKQRLAFNTHPLWYKQFIDLKLIDHCPLYAATMHFNKKSKQGSSLYLWNQIIPEGKNQRKVAGLRSDHHIGNGLTVSRVIGKYQLHLGLATDPKDHELEKKYNLVMPIILTLFSEASLVCLTEFDKVLSKV